MGIYPLEFMVLPELSRIETYKVDTGSGDCGVYIKKLFRCTLFLRNIHPSSPVTMMKQGIYRKIFCLYPAYRKKVDLEGHFFRIYPVVGEEINFIRFKGPAQGTGGKFFPIYPGRPPNQNISYIPGALSGQ